MVVLAAGDKQFNFEKCVRKLKVMIRPDFHNSFAGHSFYTPFLYGKVSS
jgi:hypothetical protein